MRATNGATSACALAPGHRMADALAEDADQAARAERAREDSAAARYAYLAGVIDATGHVTIARRRPRSAATATTGATAGAPKADPAAPPVATRRPAAVYYWARVSVEKAEGAIPARFHAQFGGSLGSRPPKDATRQALCWWAAASRLAADALRCLLPFLVLKRPQAELALALAARMGAVRGGEPLDADELRERARLFQAVAALNRRLTRRVPPEAPDQPEQPEQPDRVDRLDRPDRREAPAPPAVPTRAPAAPAVAGAAPGAAGRDTLYAYLAGVIDAGGFIAIGRTECAAPRSRRRATPRSLSHGAIVGIAQLDRTVPALLHRVFGGTVVERPPRGPNRHASYVWHVSDQAAAQALRCLLPYLEVRRRQADLALALQARIAPLPGGERLDPAEVAAREALYEAVTALNHGLPAAAEVRQVLRLVSGPQPNSEPGGCRQ